MDPNEMKSYRTCPRDGFPFAFLRGVFCPRRRRVMFVDIDRMIANRPYSRIEDLPSIKGFGEKKLEKIRNQITV